MNTRDSNLNIHSCESPSRGGVLVEWHNAPSGPLPVGRLLPETPAHSLPGHSGHGPALRPRLGWASAPMLWLLHSLCQDGRASTMLGP